jgi:hypothetical protein
MGCACMKTDVVMKNNKINEKINPNYTELNSMKLENRIASSKKGKKSFYTFYV